MIMETMEKEAAPAGKIPDRCQQCRGCIYCDEAYCPFNAHGDTDRCRMDKCKYCTDFLKRERLYLNNVG